MSDEHDSFFAECAESSHNCLVVAVMAIAMELNKVRHQIMDIVKRVRPLRMTGKLYALPSGQIGEDALSQLVHFFLQFGDLIRDIEIIGVFAHLLDLLLQLDNRSLKFQRCFGHNADAFLSTAL